MIKALLVASALCALTVCAPAQAAFTPPKAADYGTGQELDLRAFLKRGDFSALLEREQRWDTDNRHEQNYTLGGYYRVRDPLKLGFFYRRSYGVRHDEDWVNPGPGWGWNNSDKRAEDIVIVDATPRMLLPFLPGTNWVAELKARYHHNFFDAERTLTMRPGLTYFWLRDDEPFLNLFLQYELSMPLNYGTTTVSDRWLYAGGLYHLADFLELGGFVTFHQQTWSTSQAFLAKFGIPYVTNDRSLLLGLSAILQF